MSITPEGRHRCCASLPPEAIQALRTEAGQAGDLEMVEICDLALNGDESAFKECERVINDARALIDLEKESTI